jgi:hypothetical protein
MSIRSRHIIIGLGSSAIFLAMVLAAMAFPTKTSPARPTPLQSRDVDRFISPLLSPRDRSIIRSVMLQIPSWQWSSGVIFFDFAGDGRVYANDPSLLRGIETWARVPGYRNLFVSPSGEVRAFPNLPPPPPKQSNRFRGVFPELGLPLTDDSGPFHRDYVTGTSWIDAAVDPTSFGGQKPPKGDVCSAWTLAGKDGGYAYAAVFANTNSSNPSEFESGGLFAHDEVGKGFENYVAFGGKLVGSGPLDLGCTWDSAVEANVVSSTLVEGYLAGYAECTAPCTPKFESKTLTLSVPAAAGFNLAGKNETSTINVTIAEPIPQKSPGYTLDGSFFAMEVLPFAQGDAGTGPPANPAFECQLSDPSGYVGGENGICSNGFGYYYQPGDQVFPTPLPRVVYVEDFGQSGGEYVDICLAGTPCAKPTIWCEQDPNNCPPGE